MLMHKGLILAPVIIVGLLTLSACSGQNAPSTPATSSSASPSSSGTGSSGSGATAKDSQGRQVQFKYGQTVPYTGAETDGFVPVDVTVSAPTPFTPSQYASGADQSVNLVFTVTIKNNSSTQAYDPSLIDSSVVSGDAAGSAVYDTSQKIEGSMGLPKVLPGKSITYQEGWSVASASDVTFQITPDMINDEDIFFTS